MSSIFTKIIAGDIPCYKIAEDDRFFAFLDINPLAEGHTLVIPKEEVDYIFDLEDNLLGAMQIFAKKVAVALRQALPCIRVGQLVIGTEVPHAHIHLIPFQREDQMAITSERVAVSPQRMEEIASSVRAIIA